MILYVLSILLSFAQDPTAEQLTILKIFRSEFIKVTPGDGPFPESFRMGDANENEYPEHKVTMESSFEVAKYEVTQNLYETVMGDNPSRWKGKRNSVEMVTFAKAQEFCERVTQLMRGAKMIGEDEVVRLPTEAEWEYVARAGTETKYSFGDDIAVLGDYGWFTGNAAGNDPPVGAKKPNPWGLYDIHGYVSEWCLVTDADVRDPENSPSDGSGRSETDDKNRHVIRGGSWKDQAEALRSAARSLVPQNFADDSIGFRCVLAREQQPGK